MKWWEQFSKLAKVELYPWRSFSSQHQKLFFLNNIIGKFLFKILIFISKYNEGIQYQLNK
jgi:hypothetical protein